MQTEQTGVTNDPAGGPTKRRSWGWIVVGIILVEVGLVAVYLAFATSRNSMEPSSETFSGVRVIELDIDNGRVTITGANTEQVTAQGEISVGFMAGEARYEQIGETLRIIHDCPWLFGRGCRSSFGLTVPENTVVTGRTSNGSIEITNVGGELNVGTRNGIITATGLRSTGVNLRTNNGRVELQFEETPTSVFAHTRNGAVEVLIPSDSPAINVDATTSNGRVDTEVRVDPSSAHRFDLGTSNGNIQVGYSR